MGKIVIVLEPSTRTTSPIAARRPRSFLKPHLAISERTSGCLPIRCFIKSVPFMPSSDPTSCTTSAMRFRSLSSRLELAGTISSTAEVASEVDLCPM